MGYVVAEVAGWVGPTLAQGGASPSQGTPQTPAHGASTLEGQARTLPQTPQRLEVTQNTPSQGQENPSLTSQPGSQGGSQGGRVDAP